MKPIARLVGYSVIGVDPTIMGIGPSPAIKLLLKACGKSLNDIDLIEVSSIVVKKEAIFDNFVFFLGRLMKHLQLKLYLAQKI